MPQEKKWVFTELVKDPNNLEQLLAYAIYKQFKDEIAKNARKNGMTDVQIEAELTHYHNQCLDSQQTMEMFRNKAKDTLDGYVSYVGNQLKASLSSSLNKLEEDKNKEIKKLEAKVKSAERAALKDLTNGAKEYAKKAIKPTHTEWAIGKVWVFIKFLFSGVPKFVATTLSMGFLVAVVTLVNGDAKNMVRAALTELVDLVAPPARYDNTKSQVQDVAPPSNKQNNG